MIYPNLAVMPKEMVSISSKGRENRADRFVQKSGMVLGWRGVG